MNSKQGRLFTMLILVALGLTSTTIFAQREPFSHWDEDRLSQPAFDVRMEHNVQVPMRDGVTLSVDIYFPDAQGQFPALLVRTPYSNNTQGDIDEGRWFAQRGYVYVTQDVRGKYDSNGQFYHYRNEANDGYDTDQWIGSQSWSNGKIGTIGGSYFGYTQLTQALLGSEYLVAAAPRVTTSDIFNHWVYVDGAFHYGFALPWGAVSTDGRVGQTGAADMDAAFRKLPIIEAGAAAAHDNQAYRDWLLHPRRSDPYWDDISFEKEIHNVSIPIVTLEGWYDIFLRGALDDHLRITENSPSELARNNKKLMIGPWRHATGVRYNAPGTPTTGPDRSIDFGPEAEIELRKYYLRWHDYWLKGIDNGVAEEPPVKIFVMGENYWRYENEWPLARTQYTQYYFQSGGEANSINGDGTLSTNLPRGNDTDSFTYDPSDPVPSAGGNVCCTPIPQGPWDQRKVEIRDDVLVYTSPVLEEPLEVTGPIKVVLYASTTAVDTDWTAKLVDVHPDGYAQNIQDGIIRARYRNGTEVPAELLEAGEIYEYEIDLWATSNVFLPGHRLRVEVSSSNFPRFDRNLNTGEDPATGTRMEVAEQTVYHSGQYPSHIILPLIPYTDTTASR